MQFSAFVNHIKNKRQRALSGISNMLDDNGRVKAFYEEPLRAALVDYLNSGDIVFCASWEGALAAVLDALEIGEGETVFLPAFAPAGLLRPLIARRCTPVFCDIHPRTFTLDIVSLQRELQRNKVQNRFQARAVIAIDSFGLPADYPALEKICEKYNLNLIELSVDGLGGAIRTQKAPTFGRIGICAFTVNSTVEAFSSAAAIYCHEAELADTLRLYGGQGSHDEDGAYIINGHSSPIHPLECPNLLEKLRIYRESEQTKREELATYYTIEMQDFLEVPFVPAGFSSAWQSYCLTVEDADRRSKIQALLWQKGIKTSVPHWHDLRVLYNRFAAPEEIITASAVVAEHILPRMLLLTVDPQMRFEEARQVVNTMRTLWEGQLTEAYSDN